MCIAFRSAAAAKFSMAFTVIQGVVRGQELSGVTEFQVGLPLAATQSKGTGGFTGTQRPNQIARAALPDDQRTLDRWFNTDAFAVAPAFTSGNELASRSTAPASTTGMRR